MDARAVGHHLGVSSGTGKRNRFIPLTKEEEHLRARRHRVPPTERGNGGKRGDCFVARPKGKEKNEPKGCEKDGLPNASMNRS